MKKLQKLFTFIFFSFLFCRCTSEILVCPGNETPMVRVIFDMNPYVNESQQPCGGNFEDMPSIGDLTNKPNDRGKPYLEIVMTHYCVDGCVITNRYTKNNLIKYTSAISSYWRDIKLDRFNSPPSIDNVIFRTSCGGSCQSVCETRDIYTDFIFGSYDGIWVDDPMMTGLGGYYLITIYPLGFNVECCPEHALINLEEN